MEDVLGTIGGGLSDPRNYAMEAKVAGPMSMKMKLDMAVKEAEKRLADAKRAQEILAKNPELEELLNILNRTHF